jgi:hypothetical protein
MLKIVEFLNKCFNLFLRFYTRMVEKLQLMSPEAQLDIMNALLLLVILSDYMLMANLIANIQELYIQLAEVEQMDRAVAVYETFEASYKAGFPITLEEACDLVDMENNTKTKKQK